MEGKVRLLAKVMRVHIFYLVKHLENCFQVIHSNIKLADIMVILAVLLGFTYKKSKYWRFVLSCFVGIKIIDLLLTTSSCLLKSFKKSSGNQYLSYK